MILPPLNPALLHLDSDHLWLMHCADGPVPRSVVRLVRGFLHKELWPWELAWEEETLGIPAARELEQIINGVLTPLLDTASIDIQGGEVFISHARRGGSSHA